MSDLVTLADIERAAAGVAGAVLRTPLVPFPGADPELLVKAESLQPIGAFKLRGARAVIGALPEEVRARGVVAHSSGNHAQAVAYTAREFGVRAVLVIPHTAPAVKVDACAALGAEIVYVEPTLEARAGTAAQLADAHGFTLVPPFDHPGVIAGQGTVGLEIVQDRPDAQVVLVPVGGGGLISGVAAAVKALNPAARVIGVEPELAADARDSLRAGHPVGWPAEDTGRTIADALRVQRVGDLTFAHIREHVDAIVTVTDDEIRGAMRRLAREARLIAEPGGAVATAAYLYRRAELPEARTYVSVLSGGNADPALFAEVLR
ncbi:threonine ammonia-lyase [Actinomadura macrotermitis]|uniref:threonine ammonia-lyase n=1 Tax=Actinomadura macrotermitis TaxID=2585200 RepID=A0A7K0BXX8_9ACTN|nr:threonine/serine dehydratase [Actinomadura macrotermitis]MQY06037.1 L-threo-3-hydroxyaspartate ammonia-lyase [Actinomadura macrotermitis]